MELSAAQRKIAFAIVVFLLAGLGAYLLSSAGHASDQHQASGGGGGSAPTAPASTGAASTSPASTSPVTGPSAAPSPTATGVPDIYQWLPFTKAGLASAAAVAVKFGDAYGTFSYTQDAAAYVGTMSNLITDQLSAQLKAAYSLPGVALLRNRDRQVCAGSAVITGLRAYGSSSLTFIETITEKITARSNGGTKTQSFAVTVSGGDTSWQVSDIELASAGNS